MSSGWKTATLNEVCEFYNGLWKGQKPPFVTAGVIRNTNFSPDGALNDKEIAYLEVEERKLEKRKLEFGDIILEKSGGGPKQPVGRVVLFDKRDGVFSFSNFTSALRVRNPNVLDFRFLHKFLYWTYVSGKTAAIQSHSTGIRNLDSDAYKAITIGIPPFAEQKRIVEILNTAFEAIDLSKRNAVKSLENSRAIFSNVRESVFKDKGEGWADTTLGEAYDVRDGTHESPKYQRTGYPLITSKNLQEDGIDLDNVKLISELDYKDINARSLVHKGDVLFAMIGTIGNPTVVTEEPRFAIKNVALFKVKPFQSSNFLKHYLSSHSVVRKMTLEAKGTTQKFVGLGYLRQFPISRPSNEHQQEIADKLDELCDETKGLAQICKRKASAIEELRLSLLRTAFTGNL